jgi:hypothetical protein
MQATRPDTLQGQVSSNIDFGYFSAKQCGVGKLSQFSDHKASGIKSPGVIKIQLISAFIMQSFNLSIGF